MKYEGKLYGKVGGKFIDLGKTAKDYDELEEKNKWIDVKDRLPEKGERVICYTEAGELIFGMYLRESGSWASSYFSWTGSRVTYWRIIPEKPWLGE